MVDSQSIIYVLYALLCEKAGKELDLTFEESSQEHATIWASDNTFPLHVLNTGCLGQDDWEGDADLIQFIESMEVNGYSLILLPRFLNDETCHTTEKQDFKLVVRG